jgi:hypothetical protein
MSLTFKEEDLFLFAKVENVIFRVTIFFALQTGVNSLLMSEGRWYTLQYQTELRMDPCPFFM